MKKIVFLCLLSVLFIAAMPARSMGADSIFWQTNLLSSGEEAISPPLRFGVHYRVEVYEMFWYDKPHNLGADAQYYTTDGSNSWLWRNFFRAPEGHSFVQIDNRDVDWGQFSNGDTGHKYAVYYIGAGLPLKFKIVDWIDQNYYNNGCHLPLRILEVPPLPPSANPYTIGYWKNHPEAWPADTLLIGGKTYSKDEALSILRDARAKDATYMLAAQLIAAKLNILNDANPKSILTTIDKADAFLQQYPIGSNPQGTYRVYALDLKDALDYYNNGY